MSLVKRPLAGHHYLAAITTLARRVRREDSLAGLYEVADFHWWWREDEAPDPELQLFWWDEAGGPVAALLLYDDGTKWTCDFIRIPSEEERIAVEVLPHVLERLADLNSPATLTVREDDALLRDALAARGWSPTAGGTIQMCLGGGSATSPRLPPGFRFSVRAQLSDSPHPMTLAKRNPLAMERRLWASAVYRADLDYAIWHESGALSAYALFWFDPETGVGLVEPMRTEAAFQRQGLGRALLTEGIRRLQGEGATSIRVSYLQTNAAARSLYRSCGFRDLFRKLEYAHA